MKKTLLTLSFFFLTTVIFSLQVYSQWDCVLATQDDTPNGPGYQVPSVALIKANTFVALVLRAQIPAGQTFDATDDANLLDSVSANYLVGYSNPTDTSGRMTNVPYAQAGNFTKWVSGFDEIQLYRAYKTVGTPDSLVYVANNDDNHNVLVFRLSKDSVISTDYRLATDAAGTGKHTSDIMGLAVDNNGYVYVLNVYGSTANTKEVRIYKGIKSSATTWGTSHTDTPVSTIDLPTGVYRGLAVSPDGKQLFISNVSARTVIKYHGTPTTGYTKETGFNFALTVGDTIPLSVAPDTARPLGMAYLSPNNILFVACARWLGVNIKTHGATSAYQYSRIYAVNPNTGAKMTDSLDVANYYFLQSGSYSTQIFVTQHVSGYSSTYDVVFDANKDLYSQSFYSWTVEKWHNAHTLPTIILGVREVSNSVPEQYSLAQNYPNPFNPTTTIQFSLKTGSRVELTVMNVLGQPVKTLVNEEVAAGTHEVTFDASTMASGIYFYTLRTGNFTETKKMILTK